MRIERDIRPRCLHAVMRLLGQWLGWTLIPLLMTLAPAARAATVTLDLTALGNLTLAAGQSQTFTLGGSTTTVNGVTTTTSALTVTVLAMTYAGRAIPTTTTGGQTTIGTLTTSGAGQNTYQSALNFSASGAGVTNSLEGTRRGVPRDNPAVDAGGGKTDFIEILLSSAATLDAATFVDQNVRFGVGRSSLVWASDTTGTGSISTGDAISAATSLASASFGGAASDAFMIAASGGGSRFNISTMTLSYTPTVTTTVAAAALTAPSPVPLPASAPLLLAALGGLAFLRRR
ncbi:MAG: VPLPA-CTERM sorting domain-containing protein [Paracoccaceae bacterium]|nr:VPLPA-CTERM sorting domain-containing protein [Paracoccaceae bacterium]